MSHTMPYSKLYILTELSANDVKFISVDRQKLDISKYTLSKISNWSPYIFMLVLNVRFVYTKLLLL